MRRPGTRKLVTSSMRCGPPWRITVAVARVTALLRQPVTCF